jgi:hypothetical protein
MHLSTLSTAGCPSGFALTGRYRHVVIIFVKDA